MATTRSAESIRLSNTITALAATLTAFGIVMIYSASSIGSELRHEDATIFLRKQALWVALAAIVFALARTTDLEWLEKRSKPILESLRTWLNAQLALVSRKSIIAEAIRYALTRWPGLERFLDDGRIEIDSNPVERAIRVSVRPWPSGYLVSSSPTWQEFRALLV